MEESVIKELNALEIEKKNLAKELNALKTSMADKLIKGNMGKDMDDVLSGRKNIDIPKSLQIKAKIKKILDSVFSLF